MDNRTDQDRPDLRDFQEDLAQRLASAAQGEGSAALLGIQAGRAHWLVNLSDAGEIVPLPPLTRVPLTKSWFAGIANIRGTLYSVVDFSAFLYGEPTAPGGEARLLLIGTRHGSNSALLVSRTLGLKNPEGLVAETRENGEMEGASLPAAEPAWAGEHYVENGVSPSSPPLHWRVLQVKPLLGDAKFLDIAL